jgi:hypothetical protein
MCMASRLHVGCNSLTRMSGVERRGKFMFDTKPGTHTNPCLHAQVGGRTGDSWLSMSRCLENLSAPRSMLTKGLVDISLECTLSPGSGVRGVPSASCLGLDDWSDGSALGENRLPVRMANGAAEKKLPRLPKLPRLTLRLGGACSCSSSTCSMAGCVPVPGKREVAEARCVGGLDGRGGKERWLLYALLNDRGRLTAAALVLGLLAPSVATSVGSVGSREVTKNVLLDVAVLMGVFAGATGVDGVVSGVGGGASGTAGAMSGSS